MAEYMETKELITVQQLPVIAEQLDGALREIFGDDLVPFAERHPYIRGIDYTKKRR